MLRHGLKTDLAAKNLIDRSRLLECTFLDHLLAHLLHEEHECIQWLLDVRLIRPARRRWGRRLGCGGGRCCYGNRCRSPVVWLPCLTAVVVSRWWMMMMMFWHKCRRLPATRTFTTNTSLFNLYTSSGTTTLCCISLLHRVQEKSVTLVSLYLGTKYFNGFSEED